MKAAVVLAATAVLAFGVLEARQNSTKPQSGTGSEGSPIRAEVTRVNMLFSVTDHKGRFVTDLTRDDFTVYENKLPQKIMEFTSETDLPLRLAILIDTSNSIRDRFRFQQEAATNFINGVMRPQDKAVIVSFDTAAELVADLTSDTNKLENAVTQSPAGWRDRPVRCHLLRLPRQANGRSAPLQVPSGHGDTERRGRQRK